MVRQDPSVAARPKCTGKGDGRVATDAERLQAQKIAAAARDGGTRGSPILMDELTVSELGYNWDCGLKLVLNSELIGWMYSYSHED